MTEPIKAISGEEYVVQSQGNKLKKIATIFSIIWAFLIIAPFAYVVFLNSAALRNFLVVKGVYEANLNIMDQYSKMTSSLVEKINLDKYAAKIKIPEIKLDKVANGSEKVAGIANTLGALGLKGATKVAASSNKLQEQVDKINKQIKDISADMVKATTEGINQGLKEEMAKLGEGQMQKQLKLNDINYKNLMNDNYGVLTASMRANSQRIYGEFEKKDPPLLKWVIALIEKYYGYIVAGFVIAAIVISGLPIWLVWKGVGMFTKNFNQCPYCKKIYLTKEAKFNLLKLFKFW